MRYASMILILAITISATVYAHYRLPFHTPNRTQLWATRLLLIAIGMAFGWAMSDVYTDVQEGAAVLVFLSAFGVVHIPAAIILWIKRKRKE